MKFSLETSLKAIILHPIDARKGLMRFFQMLRGFMSQGATVSELMIAWYDRHKRSLPWRVGQGEADPYKVWLSEIMLQQTTVQAVKPYFEAFTSRWPTVADLAAAEDEAVMAAWAGLGYYSRARNLLKAARKVVADFGGAFPSKEEELLTLPGVGPYTAAAIASIAFNQPAVVVDGNIERVMSRLFEIKTPLPDAKAEIKERAASLTPAMRPGDYAQSLMDLGATICSPKRPACVLCPLTAHCEARKSGTQEDYPVKAPKKLKPNRYGRAFLALQPDGSLLLERRKEKGLLGSMVGVPHSDWLENRDEATKTANAQAPFNAAWKKIGMVKHTFTHFHLEMEVMLAHVRYSDKLASGYSKDTCFFEGWSKLEAAGLPTVFKKVVNVGAEHMKKPSLGKKARA